MKRDSFIVYGEWEEGLKCLPPEILKEVVLAMFSYGLERKLPENCSVIAGCFVGMMKPLLDKDWEKYLKKLSKQRPIDTTLKDLRKTKEYHQWREAVLRRDLYTCQTCGQKGGKLEVHHIRPFATFEEDRLNIDNGITLCKKCHKKWHKVYRKSPKETYLL